MPAALQRPAEGYTSLAAARLYITGVDGYISLTKKDPNEARRLKQQERNRAQSATSRERKRSYIEQLEGRIADLSERAATLRSKNDALRSELAPLRQTVQVHSFATAEEARDRRSAEETCPS